MDLGLNETQQMLRTSAREFLESECPASYVRDMERDERGYTPQLWDKLAGLGWLGLIVPEEYGGIGLGFVELAVVLEEMGRVLMPGPYFSTVVMAGMTVADAGSEEQKREFLSGIASGRLIMTLALTEPSGSWDADGVQAAARKSDDGYVLNGTKLYVPNANVSDYVIVAARTGQGESDISLFVVPSSAEGLTVTSLDTLASDKQSELVLNNVHVPGSALLGEIDGGWETLERILAWGAVAKCAEMLGGAQQTLDMTVAYARAANTVREGYRILPGDSASCRGHGSGCGRMQVHHIPGCVDALGRAARKTRGGDGQGVGVGRLSPRVYAGAPVPRSGRLHERARPAALLPPVEGRGAHVRRRRIPHGGGCVCGGAVRGRTEVNRRRDEIMVTRVRADIEVRGDATEISHCWSRSRV